MSASNPNSEVFEHDAGSARHRCRYEIRPISRRDARNQVRIGILHDSCDILMSTIQRNPDCERAAK